MNTTLPSLPLLPPNPDARAFRAFFAVCDLWTTGNFTHNDAHCAFGHIRRHAFKNDVDSFYTAYSKIVRNRDVSPDCPIGALARVFEPLRASFPPTIGHEPRSDIVVPAIVNDGRHPLYQQPTPKARILAALDDLIAMEDAALGAAHEAIETRPLVPVSRPAVVQPEPLSFSS